MKRKNLIFLIPGIFLTLLTVCGSVSAQPKLPYYDRGACPFECCTYREWRANKATVLYAEMREGSAVAFRVKKGERVKGITGVVITTKAGRLKVTRATMLDDYSLKPGELLYLLTYTGEGYYNTWYKGKIFSYALYENPDLKLINEPTSIWWVKIRNRAGKIGWTKLPENFDNKDSCG